MLKVRPAEQNDLHVLADLWLEKMVLVAQADARFSLSTNAAAEWASGAAQWLTDARCMIIVAEQDNEITGFTIGWLQAAPPGVLPTQIGMITELALDMHQYQQGLARALLAELRQWFSTQGVHQVAALVPHRHPVQQAFWRSLGATEWIDFLWLR